MPPCPPATCRNSSSAHRRPEPARTGHRGPWPARKFLLAHLNAAALRLCGARCTSRLHQRPRRPPSGHRGRTGPAALTLLRQQGLTLATGRRPVPRKTERIGATLPRKKALSCVTGRTGAVLCLTRHRCCPANAIKPKTCEDSADRLPCPCRGKPCPDRTGPLLWLHGNEKKNRGKR